MKVFIAAIPFFNTDMAVQAYFLSSQSGDRALSVKNDFRGRGEALVSPGLELLEKVGTEPFAGDAPLFVEISRLQLLMGYPQNLNMAPGSLICTIPGGLPADSDLLQKCEALKAQGYALALENFPLNGIQSQFFNHATYLFLDYKNPRFEEVVRAVHLNLKHIQAVVTNVPDMETYQGLCGDPVTKNAWFSGNFYRQPITRGVAKISPIKVNALQLLKQVNEGDFELSDIARIIQRDPALSISLLRFLNSNPGLSRKIDSIQNAVAILGQQEVRRWATVAISVSLAEDRPGEITKLSLVRAKYAENLAPVFQLGVFQPQLFIAGLFSLLDVILQKPMTEAIREVSVDQRVYDALVEQKGMLYKVMQFIYAYEHADWAQTSILLIQNDLDIEQVNAAYIDALVWYDQLLRTIDGAGGDGEAPA